MKLKTYKSILPTVYDLMHMTEIADFLKVEKAETKRISDLVYGIMGGIHDGSTEEQVKRKYRVGCTSLSKLKDEYEKKIYLGNRMQNKKPFPVIPDGYFDKTRIKAVRQSMNKKTKAKVKTVIGNILDLTNELSWLLDNADMPELNDAACIYQKLYIDFFGRSYYET
ncbi:MAG: hypothetical protein ACYCS0_01095 [bacterium]